MEEAQLKPRRTPGSRVAVVIPAAGSGLRMGGMPKQFRTLGDAPVLVQTLRAFGKVEAIVSTVVAVPINEVGEVEGLLREFGLAVNVVAGGATRQDSVGEGLAFIGASVDIVLVHDAVRPFISTSQIREVIEAIEDFGAAAVAVPATDTLRRGTNSVFGETVEREGLFRMLTPQGARTALLQAAHRQASDDNTVATDEIELLRRAGIEVRIVPGDERNIKLTHSPDWALAEALWPAWANAEN